MDELYELTRAMFGNGFAWESEWEKGWRPVLDDNQDGTKDILWQSPLGSYSRVRDSEIDRLGLAARYCFDKLKEKLSPKN